MKIEQRQNLIVDADDTLWENNIYFERNLTQCYHKLTERDVGAEDLPRIMSFTEQILHHPIEIIPGVEETLEYLSERHALTLFTKGDPEEQKLKLDRSGLGIYFGHTAIVKEKDARSYAALLRERALDREHTWMIGNSPKSDINPALEAGIHAVFVPHARTWSLERAELREGPGRLLKIARFEELREYF